MSLNEETLATIEKVLPLAHQGRYMEDDRAVLLYVKSQLQPERLLERAEQDVLGDDSSDILRAVAKQRCAPYRVDIEKADADALA